MHELLSVRQAAEILSVSQSTIYALCQAGKLPHYRIGVGSGTLRFKREDISAYIQSCYRNADGQATPAEAPRRRHKSRSLKRLRFLDDCL